VRWPAMRSKPRAPTGTAADPSCCVYGAVPRHRGCFAPALPPPPLQGRGELIQVGRSLCVRCVNSPAPRQERNRPHHPSENGERPATPAAPRPGLRPHEGQPTS
jgi:hypothetical protein